VVDPIRVRNGEVSVPEGPGLGVELDMDKMKKYANGPTVVVGGG
jgi:L-alanine-DL-glutamate epimerase-like enolase superfamily enzyme